MQAAGTPPQSLLRTVAPPLLLVAIGVAVALGTATAGPIAFLPVFGVLFVVLVALRPEYGIALFLSTFLTRYPAWLAGSGFLTINNVLGALFLLLLSYKVYRDQDWWFLRSRELRVLLLVVAVYWVAERFNSPDIHYAELVGLYGHAAGTLQLFVNRCFFVLFFVNFIRTPAHVRMIYWLALGFMVVTALAGIQSILEGAGAYGYRATTGGEFIYEAINPNRLAMFAILAIAGLWYNMRRMRTGLNYLIVPVIVVLAFTVLLTASRSGLLGLLVCALAITIDERFGFRTLFNFGLALLLLMTMAIQFVPEKNLERITNLPGTTAASDLGSGSVERRQYVWGIAYELFLQSPIVGVGMGNWDVARFLHDPKRSTGSPHSSYLLALVEGGIFALALMLYLLWCTWDNLRWAERYLVDPRFPLASLAWVVKAAKASLLVLIFFSLFADLWQLVILFWLVGLSIVIRRMVEQVLAGKPVPAA